MKYNGKHDIEYWLTRSKSGKLIRVYRVDAKETFDIDPQHPFDIPILVEYTGIAEGIADILEDREKIKEELDSLKDRVRQERLKIADQYRIESQKKWYEFWK